jgi:hypothetical protein
VALGLVTVSELESLKDDFTYYKLNVGKKINALG